MEKESKNVGTINNADALRCKEYAEFETLHRVMVGAAFMGGLPRKTVERYTELYLKFKFR